MFDVLSRGFKNARLKLQGKTELTEANIADSLREVRSSLIQADVQIGVIKEFMAAVKVRALGDIVPLRAPTGEMMDVSPDDWFIKACYDELVELMGPERRRPQASSRRSSLPKARSRCWSPPTSTGQPLSNS
jgi:signal recognition particle subunit SRP54